MHPYTSLLRPRLLIIVGLAACALSVTAGPALATNGPQYGSIGQYGEVFRGGGFDNCWFDAGSYDGKGCNPNETQAKPGEFVDPVGFATDTKDPDPSGSGTALYVLDRTSDLPHNVASASGTATSWRLQKLSSTGTVEGVDEFSLPADTPTIENNANGITDYEMFGLAVDPANSRVYSLLVGYDNNTGNEVVQEILSWSTAPSGSNTNTSQTELQPAGGLTADTISSGVDSYPTPAALSTLSDLTAGSSSEQFNGNPDIENPTGIAIDVSGGTDYVAVQGDDPTTTADGAGIVAVDPTSGDIVTNWSSSNFASLANDFANEIKPGAGLSTNPVDGSLTWLDDRESGDNTPEDFDVGSVPANLTSAPTVLSSPSNGVTNADLNTLDTDDAAVSTADVPPETYDDGTPLAATATSSPQEVALSNGLYAGVFEPEPAGQVDPANPASQDGEYTPLDPGIRLLQPASGLLSESAPPLLTLFDTLGNSTINTSGSTTAGSACNITDSGSSNANAPTNPSLSAGSNGAVWVLTNGQDTSGDGTDVTGNSGSAKLEGGRELIELAPGATDACPGPSGSFTMAAGSNTATAGSSTLTVPEGTTVSFDASGIQYPGNTTTGRSAARAAYEWNFGDGNSTTTLDSATSPFTWPNATTSEHFTAIGNYTVTLDLFGDYGEYVETGSVDVQPTTLASASFTFSPPSPTAGQSVTFNGLASTPSTGGTINEYEWNFGDGQTANTSTASESHTYASAGTYTVSLKVLDTNNDTSTAKTESVTVAPVQTTTTTTTTTTSSPPSNKFTISSLKGQKGGSILAKLSFPDAGKVSVKATFKAKVKVKSGKKTKTKTETITFVSASKSVPEGAVTLSLTPSGAAKSVLKALASKSSVSVSVTITFTPTGGTAAKKSGTAHVAGLKKKKK